MHSKKRFFSVCTALCLMLLHLAGDAAGIRGSPAPGGDLHPREPERAGILHQQIPHAVLILILD